MEIKTNFNLGDSVWTIRDYKAAEIEVRSMSIDESGVWVHTADDYRRYHEDKCFATKEELIAYITSDD